MIDHTKTLQWLSLALGTTNSQAQQDLVVPESLPHLPDHSPITLSASVSSCIFTTSKVEAFCLRASDPPNPSPNHFSPVPRMNTPSCLLHILNQITHLCLLLWPLYFFFTVISTLPIIRLLINKTIDEISDGKPTILFPVSVKGLPLCNFSSLSASA